MTNKNDSHDEDDQGRVTAALGVGQKTAKIYAEGGVAPAEVKGVVRLLGSVSRNKRKVGVVGVILALLIGVVAFLFIAVAGNKVVLINQALQSYKFGPHNRGVVGRAILIHRYLINPTPQMANSNFGQKAGNIAADPVQRGRAAGISAETVSRYQRRVPFRNLIGSRMSSPFNWRFFSGTRPAANQINMRNKIVGAETPRTRAPAADVVPDDGTSGTRHNSTVGRTVDEIQRNPQNSRQIARRGALRLSRSGVIAIIMLGCLASVYEDQIVPQIEELYEIYMGASARFMAAGSQLQIGEDIHGEEISELNAGLSETAERVDFDTGEIIGTTQIDFTDSESWKRATNQPLTGSEPDAGLAFGRLTGNAGFAHQAIFSFGYTINLHPGQRLFCRAVSNPHVQTVFVSAEVLAALATAGKFEAVKRLAVNGFLIFGLSWLIEQVAFGHVLPENPATLIGTVGMGMNLSQAEYALSQGAPPLSNAEANSLRAEHLRLLAQEDRERGTIWRHLALDNPRSTLNRIALSSSSGDTSAAGVAKSLAKVPSGLFNVFGSLFVVQADSGVEFDNYGIQQYGFTADDLTHDPLENAEYVERRLSCALNDSGSGCTEAIIAEGELMVELLERCIEADNKYYELSSFCKTADGDKRRAWARVGLWKLDHGIVDAFECLSHDESCPSGESLLTSFSGSSNLANNVSVAELDL